MASEAELILGWFDRRAFGTGVLQFDDLLAEAVGDVLGKSALDTEPYVYSNSNDLWNSFLGKLDSDRRLGRSILFEIRDRATRRVRWIPSCVGQMLTGHARHRAVSLAARPAVLQRIDALTSREYEALGCVVSQLAGATRVFLTPPGNDAGIDFLAIITVPARCHVFGGAERPLRIIGQSKKYSNRADVAEIREFITTITEIQNQSSDLGHLIPPWFWAANGPIVGWFIAHSGVQSGGATKARNHGILVSDSLDLAEIIALAHSVDRSSPPLQRADAFLGMINRQLLTNQH